MRTPRIVRRHRRSLGVSVVIIVFVLALVGWIHRGASPVSPISGLVAPQSSQPADPQGSPSPSPGSSPMTSAGGGIGGVSVGGVSLAPLPNAITDLNGYYGTHAVTLRAVSDAPIPILDYAITGGNPPKVERTFVTSPATVTTIARGKLVVVELLVQASPLATYISCSVTVDGRVTTQSARGPYRVIECVAFG